MHTDQISCAAMNAPRGGPVVAAVGPGAHYASGSWPPYRIEHITQPVDHFNALTSNATFKQRYLREDSNFTKGGPIFAFTGGEGGDVPRFYTAYDTPIGFARRLGGMIIFMEMRFFGTSDTVNASSSCAGGVEELCPTAGRLGLLSVEQVLADYTRLLVDVRRRCGADCASSSVVTFGGSLAGTLAALMRLRAPWLVDFAYASSAPLLGYDGIAGIDQYSWRARVTSNWRELGSGESCVEVVRRGFRALALANASMVAKTFGVCEGTWGADVALSIQGIAWGILEGEGTHPYPPKLSQIQGRCDAMLKAAAAAAAAGGAAAATADSTDRSDGIDSQAAPQQPVPADAVPTDLGIFRALLAWSPSPAPPPPSPPPKCLNLTRHAESRNAVAWDFLACTEVLHPIGSNNVTDFFPPGPWTVASTAAFCRQQFAEALTPRPHWLPTQFGLYELARFKRAASHILFTCTPRGKLQNPHTHHRTLTPMPACETRLEPPCPAVGAESSS